MKTHQHKLFKMLGMLKYKGYDICKLTYLYPYSKYFILVACLATLGQACTVEDGNFLQVMQLEEELTIGTVGYHPTKIWAMKA